MDPNQRKGGKEPPKPMQNTETIGYRGLTLAQLKKLLIQRGIAFTYKQKKDDLIKLLYETDINKKQLSTKYTDETDPDGSLRFQERVDKITSDMKTLDLFYNDEIYKAFRRAETLRREWCQDRLWNARELSVEDKLYNRRSEKMISRANFEGDKQAARGLTRRRINDAHNSITRYRTAFGQPWGDGEEIMKTSALQFAKHEAMLDDMETDQYSDISNPSSPPTSPIRATQQGSMLQSPARRSSPVTYNLISDDEEPQPTKYHTELPSKAVNSGRQPQRQGLTNPLAPQPHREESGNKRKNTQPPHPSNPTKKIKNKSARDRAEGRPQIQIDHDERSGRPAPSDDTLASLKWYIESLGAENVDFYAKDKRKWYIVWDDTEEGETAMWKFNDNNAAFDWNGYKIQHCAFIPRHHR